jgi:hypothetical protein
MTIVPKGPRWVRLRLDLNQYPKRPRMVIGGREVKISNLARNLLPGVLILN